MARTSSQDTRWRVLIFRSCHRDDTNVWLCLRNAPAPDRRADALGAWPHGTGSACSRSKRPKGPPHHGDRGTGSAEMAGGHRLRQTRPNRNDYRTLQDADRTATACTVFPGSEAAIRLRRSQPRADKRRPGVRPTPKQAIITDSIKTTIASNFLSVHQHQPDSVFHGSYERNVLPSEFSRRHAAGGMPYSRRNALLNAASDS